MRVIVLIIALGTLVSCTDQERLAKLEKQNLELQDQVKRTSATQQFELEDKCAKEGKDLLREEFGPPDKDTMLLTNNNHYNKKLNHCIVLVEWHYKAQYGDSGSWINDITLWDVQEHSKYGYFSESHEVHFTPHYHVDETVLECKVEGTDCKTMDEFSSRTHSYMND